MSIEQSLIAVISVTPAPYGPPDPTITNIPSAIPTYTEASKAVLDSFNPLLIEKSPADVVAQLSSPAGIISRLLTFLFPLAGLAVFVLLIVAGFEIMGAAATKKSIDTGKQRATAAVVGFILLFVSYWLIKILEMIFNLKILGS